MNAIAKITNAARRLDQMFPGFFAQIKHNHYKDFGWPEHVSFHMLFQMYLRNGLAHASVEKTILKVWQDNPQIWESENPTESTLESQIRQRLEDLRFWQKLADADRMSLVGAYSGVILRYADSKRFQEPVDRVPGGLDGLVEIIPAWEGQLQVSEWDTNEESPTYGQPLMFQFNEAEVVSGSDRTFKTRSFMVHPDRCMIWSQDGTVHGHSLLKPGYNDLITLEKVSGAGGEGFWKNAKSAPVLQVDKDAKIKDMAEAMGVPVDEVADKMDEQVGDWQKGFDALLMLQGIEAKTLGVTLPQPEHFFNIALQSFAASVDIPQKILVGNQTGERASLEDRQEWNRTGMARRVNVVKPNIRMLMNRLEAVGILPNRDWTIHWGDLTESSVQEKIDRVAKMAEINAKMGGDGLSVGEVVFTGDEMRAAVDMDPLPDAEKFTDEGEMT